MKMLTSLLVAALIIIGVSSAAEAGRLYDQYGPESPKVIQSDDTVASTWDESLGGWKQVLVSCIQGEDPCGLTNTSLMRVSGGRVRLFNVMTGVTTNTTSATVDIHSGGKTPIASVVGDGSVAAVVTLYGDADDTTTNGIELCVITLSGTDRHTKGCDSGEQFTKDYFKYHAVTSGVTGTDATVTLDVAVGAAGSVAGAGGGAGDASAANQTTMITALQLIDDDQTGASVHHRISAGTTEDEHEVKATAGRLLGAVATSTLATVSFARCANLTAANTTPGTSTVFIGFAIPGATTGAGIASPMFGPSGIAFSTALTCWIVLGEAENDVAEVGANKVNVNWIYK